VVFSSRNGSLSTEGDTHNGRIFENNAHAHPRLKTSFNSALLMLPVMSEMHNPAHPGEVLREYLPEDMSVTDAAKALNVTRQALSALLNGRSGVSADMALRLEAALGVEAGFWLRMQVAYDLWEARQRGVAKGVRHIAA